MELKMKYHYSYFIYPYVIKEKNYSKYVQRLLKNSKYTPKFFARERELSIYNYFLPNIREYIFKTFKFTNETKEIRDNLDNKLGEKILKSSPCTIFEYNLGLDAQAKTDEEGGIFFKIQKIEVICFETGICFLAIKTNIEDTDRFSDLLNFNLKFRDINSNIVGEYNNIKIQTSTFGDIKKLSEIIKEITGNQEDSEKLDVDINRFLTYSYVCLDQEYWSNKNDFNEIEKEFFKFANVLNSEFNSSFDNDRLKVISLGDYIKLGISTLGINLLTSSINTVNYTNLPFEFENEFFYTYIFTLYQKYYFAKILNSFKNAKTQVKAKKEFVKFTNEIWIHELTNSDNGIIIYEGIKDVLNLDKIYEKTKEQYDVTFKNLKMRNSDVLNKIVLILLVASIVTNIVNFINLYKLR